MKSRQTSQPIQAQLPLFSLPVQDPDRLDAVFASGAVIRYRLVRSAQRRRTIHIGLDDDGDVVVRAPLRTPLREVQAVVVKRAQWIARTQELHAARPRVRFAHGEALPFLGRALRLAVVSGNGARVVVRHEGNDLVVAVPSAPGDRTHLLRQALTRWYRLRASEVLGEKVAWWSAMVGRTPRRVLVREQRRRWGSCGPDGTLRFSWRLLMLEGALVDYVVAHELAHLIAPHHGAGFWREMARVMPDAAERRKALRVAEGSMGW